MRTIFTALLALGLGVAVLGCKKRAVPAGSAANTDPKPGVAPVPVPIPALRGKSTFTVGKSTTVVTGPKDADGRIVYAAALNERMSKGVTAENNANVALWKVLGPTPAGRSAPAGYFEKMGTTAPTGGEHFVGLREYTQQQGGNIDQAYDALGKLAQKPWAQADNPPLAAWLAANQKPLAAVIEATKKPHYYNPLIPERAEKGLLSSPLPGPQACHELARALACRAMLNAAQNPVAAWQDLLACHRLGRLVGRGGTVVEGLIGMAIEQLACRADVAFLDRARPDANVLGNCLRDLRALPALPDLVEKIDLGERFTFLETIMLLDKHGVAHLTNLAEGPGGAPPFGDDVLAGIDWNPALEAANKTFDRFTAALREKDRAKRNAQITQIEHELNTLRHSLASGGIGLSLKYPKQPAAVRGADVGTALIAFLTPDVRKIRDAADRTTQTHEIVITAFACAWYQRFNGKYPDKLQDLVPTYLSAVPPDLFSGQSLIYSGGANGFSLHSVGPNGTNEGGDNTPPRDDIGVRLPVVHKP